MMPGGGTVIYCNWKRGTANDKNYNGSSDPDRFSGCQLSASFTGEEGSQRGSSQADGAQPGDCEEGLYAAAEGIRGKGHGKGAIGCKVSNDGKTWTRLINSYCAETPSLNVRRQSYCLFYSI